MKKLLVILFVFQCFIISAESGINLVPLQDDLSTLFTGIGQDLIPVIQQNSISGGLYGEAEINEVFIPFYLSIPAVSITTTDGIATVLSDDSQEWKLSIAELPNLVASAITGDTQQYYDLTQRIFALPTVKLGFGFKIPLGLELHFSGLYLPPLDFVAMFPDISLLSNLNVDLVDVGVNLRKTIFSDEGKSPAFSIGVHYFYSQFVLDYTFESLTDLIDERLAVPGLGDLDLDGSFAINTMVHSFGLDFHLSKRLLFFTPYVKLSPTVYISSLNTTADLKANLYPAESEESIAEEELKSAGLVEGNGLSLFAQTGFEIWIYFVAINISVSADLQNPTFNLGNAFELDFTETAVDKLSLNIGFRIQL